MKEEYTEEDLQELNKEFQELESREEHLVLVSRRNFTSSQETFVKIVRDLQEQIWELRKEISDLKLQTQEGTIAEGEILELDFIPISEARYMVDTYIKRHPGCTTSEIIESLRLDPSVIVEVLKLLGEEGKVKREEVE